MKKISLLCSMILFSTLSQAANHLTLYFIPSPKGMDWSSPSKLAWSGLQNRLSFQSRFMGHVFVEFQCGSEHELTGMVGKKFDYLRQLLIENRGLGILYHSFEGGLEEKAEIEAELKDHYQTGRVNFTKFLINDDQCKRIGQYLKEYRSNNVGRYYGLANRPLYGEGAGCSAFGASFVEVAGLLDPEMRGAWSNSVNIPIKFSGPPLQEEGVSLFKLMRNAQSWASESEPHKKLFFWDPDLMYKWVNEKLAKSPTDKTFQTEVRSKSRGIVYDRSHLPAPQGPIWQQHLDPVLQKKSP